MYVATKSEVNIYPNSFYDELNIDMNTSEPMIAKIDIADVTGRIVRNIKIVLQEGSNTNKIDMQSFSNGVYSIRISNEQGFYYTQTVRK